MRKFLSPGDIFTISALLLSLFIISRFNFLLFHSLVEIAISVVGFLAFAFTWHLRRFDLGFLFNIGILLGCTSFLGIFHLLAYKDLGVFVWANGNLSSQVWIATRYIFGIVLLVAMIFPGNNRSPCLTLAGFVTLIALSLGAIFLEAFPTCFVPGVGQTPFKIYSEYAISALIFLAMVVFYRKRALFQGVTFQHMVAFLIFSIITELVFTSYLDVFGVSNMLGHLSHLVASYFLYKAIIERGLKSPFETLFRDLSDAVAVRDEFISLASHELKTPLTPLKIQIQRLEREFRKSGAGEKSEGEIRRIVDVSHKQIDRLNQLIDGMLDLTRLTSNRFEIYPELTNLQTLASEIASRYAPQLEGRGSKLMLNLDHVECKVDPLRIEQVLTNLLSNAIRYAPGALVELGLKETETGVTLWVRDEGPGIPKERQSQIFERFERGTGPHPSGGLGLGLYLSRQIIETHGGSLELAPSERGAMFLVRLPK